MGTLETTLKFEDETIEIWRYGRNDYSVNFINADCSVRGTLLQVMDEITAVYDLEEDLIEEV